MEDKEIVIKAVEGYSFYTKPQRKLLKLLMELENDYVIKLSILELSNISGISRASIYRIIEIFEKDGILQLPPQSNTRLNTITLVPKELDVIKRNYLKKIFLK
jgi:Fe2+ or Zn2+ uptake regulation protein